MENEQYSLCWDNFHKNMSSGMHSLLENEDLVDCTLALEGQYLKAHKMVLSICSPYFRSLFAANQHAHPLVLMTDVSYAVMNDLLTFMYQGEVEVNQNNLQKFLKAAEALQIKGLTGESNENTEDLTMDDIKSTKRPYSTEEYRKQQQMKKRIVHPAKKSKVNHSEPVPITTLTPVVHSVADDVEEVVAVAPPPPPIARPQILDVKAGGHDDMVHYKVEPVDPGDQNNAFDDSQVGSFADETMEDTMADENAYFSSMDGEEEPKAGTSADGMGDSQDELLLFDESKPNVKVKRSSCRTRYVFDGFVYHTKVVTGGTRYLGCAEQKRSGCRARANMPLDGREGEFKLTKSHNHPPDLFAEEKYLFVDHLRTAVKSMPMTLKKVYDTIQILYPNAASQISYKSICSSMHRWRRQKY